MSLFSLSSCSPYFLITYVLFLFLLSVREVSLPYQCTASLTLETK